MGGERYSHEFQIQTTSEGEVDHQRFDEIDSVDIGTSRNGIVSSISYPEIPLPSDDVPDGSTQNITGKGNGKYPEMGLAVMFYTIINSC